MYRERILRAIEPLLKHGFVVVKDTEFPESFGDTEIVLSSPTLRLRFLSDRGQTFVEAQEHAGSWYDTREILRIVHGGGPLEPWDGPDQAVCALENDRVRLAEVLRDLTLRASLTADD